MKRFYGSLANSDPFSDPRYQLTPSKRQKVKDYLPDEDNYSFAAIDVDTEDKIISVAGVFDDEIDNQIQIGNKIIFDGTATFNSKKSDNDVMEIECDDINPFDPPVYSLSEDGSLKCESASKFIQYSKIEKQYIAEEQFKKQEAEILPYLNSAKDEELDEELKRQLAAASTEMSHDEEANKMKKEEVS